MKTAETTTKLSKSAFETGNFSNPGTPNGPAFMMAEPSWPHLQVFATDVAALPTTDAELKAAMGSGAPSDMSDFAKLLTFYSTVQSQANTFKNTTYPKIVKLASDLNNYADNIDGLYEGLKVEINSYNSHLSKSEKDVIQENIKAIIQQLVQSIAPYKKHVKESQADLATFVNDMEANKTEITKPGGLYDYYNNKYGTESQEVKNLISQLAIQNANLSNYQAEYNKDRILAETSPAYLAIPFVGFIAAPIVAGTFGKKATDALSEVKATEATISNLDAEKKADARLVNGLQFAKTGLNNLIDPLTKANSTIELMEGTWGDVESKLSDITDALENDFDSTLKFLLQIDFKQLIKDWQALAGFTMKFATYARVTTGGDSSTVQM